MIVLLLTPNSSLLTRKRPGDSNPRIHHGKVAGCQATSWTRNSSGGWNRTNTLPASAGCSTSEPHRNQSQRWDSNPHSPHYECGARPVERRRR